MYNFAKAKNYRGNDMLRYVCNFLIKHPELHNQEVYQPSDCGTAFCFGGWVVAISTNNYKDFCSIRNCTIADKAEKILGLSGHDCSWLFASYRSMSEIRHFVMSKMLGYDYKGYDRDGYNSIGVDKENRYRLLDYSLRLEKADEELELIP